MTTVRADSPSFSQKVKAELNKIRESGKAYKNALAYGLEYGEKNVGGVKSLINEEIVNSEDGLANTFLRGVFIACGSVSDPVGEYHLELAPPNDEKTIELLDFAGECGLKLRKGKRKTTKSSDAHSAVRSRTFLYCKSNEQVADFLAFIGAGKHSMELMNAMIFKGIRNNVNRAVNCESANIDKTTRAAHGQICDIELILAAEGRTKKSLLPDKLREIAVARRKNPEMSMADIGESLAIPISKSGVNHRLKKIAEIAATLR
jgi:DNA-binding protein WhiA